ncbi:MAG: dihydroorotase [Bdellovibrionaceae bacterium]|nr:dihydroorotase [Pseudobdellovibrionaceae bacterium]MDW8190460.1 dihydroorotase [Pseudobdellovibrionaceae bacterium]
MPKTVIELLIKNMKSLLWSPQKGWRLEVTDIAVDQGKILDVGLGLSYVAHKELHFPNIVVLPGLIDSQVHFREPGYEHKEDLYSGSKAALLGGITTVFEMPNTNPPTITRQLLDDKFNRAKGRMFVNYAFYGGGTKDNASSICDMEDHPSCPGIKVFMGSSFGPMLIDQEEALSQILQRTQKPLTVHAEDETILQKNKSELNPNSVIQHPQWRSEESCLSATKRAVNLARQLNKRVHILHVTTAQEVEFLRQNRDIATFEVLPQHLTLYAPDCYHELGTLAQQNPPIRDKNHQEALWRAVNNGWVTTLGSDHAPHTLEEKKRPYPQSPSGIPGVQTLLPIMLDHVNHNRLSLERLVDLMTIGVIRVFNLKNKGIIRPGFDADFTLVDLNKMWTIDNKDMASKCRWTPFHGKRVKGAVFAVIIGGHLCYQEGEILTEPMGQPAYFSNTK